MSDRFVPKRYSEIDLEPYGGVGKLVLRPKTKMMDGKLAQLIMKLCRENDIEFNDENQGLVTSLFTQDITVRTLQECVVVPAGEPPITEDEILNFPDELIEEIFTVLVDGTKFPLVSPPSEETKTEM